MVKYVKPPPPPPLQETNGPSDRSRDRSTDSALVRPELGLATPSEEFNSTKTTVSRKRCHDGEMRDENSTYNPIQADIVSNIRAFRHLQILADALSAEPNLSYELPFRMERNFPELFLPTPCDDDWPRNNPGLPIRHFSRFDDDLVRPPSARDDPCYLAYRDMDYTLDGEYHDRTAAENFDETTPLISRLWRYHHLQRRILNNLSAYDAAKLFQILGRGGLGEIGVRKYKQPIRDIFVGQQSEMIEQAFPGGLGITLTGVDINEFLGRLQNPRRYERQKEKYRRKTGTPKLLQVMLLVSFHSQDRYSALEGDRSPDSNWRNILPGSWVPKSDISADRVAMDLHRNHAMFGDYIDYSGGNFGNATHALFYKTDADEGLVVSFYRQWLDESNGAPWNHISLMRHVHTAGSFRRRALNRVLPYEPVKIGYLNLHEQVLTMHKPLLRWAKVLPGNDFWPAYLFEYQHQIVFCWTTMEDMEEAIDADMYQEVSRTRRQACALLVTFRCCSRIECRPGVNAFRSCCGCKDPTHTGIKGCPSIGIPHPPRFQELEG